jgi:FMN reductase
MSEKLIKPYILGIGGTTRAGSTSEKALRISLDIAQDMGARIQLIAGLDLDFPMYSPHLQDRNDKATFLIEQLRQCDGLIVSSPSYHGSVSGLVKNALDYVEDLREDPRVYLDDLPVGLIGCGAGWQGATQALTHLRSMTHALRAWPTPMGAVINSSTPLFEESGECVDHLVLSHLKLVGQQVMHFALMKLASQTKSQIE